MNAGDRRRSSRDPVPAVENRPGPVSLAAPARPVQTSGMADDHDIRPEARRLVENLPATASWDDLIYEIYVRQSVERGLADADAGRTMDHDTALAHIRARIRRAS